MSSGVMRSSRAIVSFPEPREEVALLVFEVAAHRGEFQMSVSVNETRKMIASPRDSIENSGNLLTISL
jgi:hypothetical protein